MTKTSKVSTAEQSTSGTSQGNTGVPSEEVTSQVTPSATATTKTPTVSSIANILSELKSQVQSMANKLSSQMAELNKIMSGLPDGETKTQLTEMKAFLITLMSSLTSMSSRQKRANDVNCETVNKMKVQFQNVRENINNLINKIESVGDTNISTLDNFLTEVMTYWKAVKSNVVTNIDNMDEMCFISTSLPSKTSTGSEIFGQTNSTTTTTSGSSTFTIVPTTPTSTSSTTGNKATTFVPHLKSS
jgi:hypothetical protein